MWHRRSKINLKNNCQPSIQTAYKTLYLLFCHKVKRVKPSGSRSPDESQRKSILETPVTKSPTPNHPSFLELVVSHLPHKHHFSHGSTTLILRAFQPSLSQLWHCRYTTHTQSPESTLLFLAVNESINAFSFTSRTSPVPVHLAPSSSVQN